eukprot:TRINITY_DN3686_c0_g1_i2.p1 TRINITY_DN3686_c0_g1~~TRINITY_DN3686_c0_g1_i2.p1  ORF type:complete len:216 (+),score=40.61 TRINITY_DN3686_c0_g1_i2:28-675(+)
MSKLPRSLQQASQMAHAAVEMDQQGNLQEALELYKRAAEFLEEAKLDPSLNDQRGHIETSLESYRVRIAAIESQLSGEAPLLPDAGSDGVVARSAPGELATASDPSVAQVGWQAVKTINKEGGKYLVQGYQVASALNSQYDITGTISRGVVATATAAKNVNEEYKVTERVSGAVTGAYTAAKEANEKHHITEVGRPSTAMPLSSCSARHKGTHSY